MSSLPQISERDIQDRVGAQSFQRGRSYADAGRIIATRRHDNTINGLCLGSVAVPYRLHATLEEEGVVEAECSCPVGHGGYCKHVAALLLTWLEHPEAFVEAVDLESALAEKSKEELIQLLLTVAEGSPQFEQLLETAIGADREGPASAAEFFRQQVETALLPLETHWDFSSGGYGYGGQVSAIVGNGDEMVEREEWREAASVYRGVLEGVGESDALAYDEEGSLVEAVWQSITGLGVCLDHLDDPADREPILDVLFEVFYTDISEYGGIDLSIGAPEILVAKTTPEERNELIERVRDIMPEEDGWIQRAYAQLLLELETEKLEGEAYIERCRELGLTDRLVDRLLSLGRNEEAIQEAGGADRSELLRLVPIFEQYGQAELIEPQVQRVITQDRQGYFGAAPDLRIWLGDRYKERGDYASALELALAAFNERPTLPGYQDIRELATATGGWPSIRPELMETLAEQAVALKIQIHLDEGELDDAIDDLRGLDLGQQRPLYSNDVRLQVAEAATGDRPEVAIEIYLRLADELIDLRGRENYQTAATMLGRARNLFDRLGRFEEWEEHIARLRSEHRRLPALQDELNRAEL
ncbi:MAG: SWIM zinc finger family protein [Thermomicrobiales bacterium]